MTKMEETDYKILFGYSTLVQYTYIKMLPFVSIAFDGCG